LTFCRGVRPFSFEQIFSINICLEAARQGRRTLL
jgi:hypothetical protein